MGRIERINEVIKSHDPKLFCKCDEGKLCIYRDNWKWEPYEVDGSAYYFMRPDHFFIMALTSDWRAGSEPVEHGLEPILRRLQEIDLWNRDLAGECIKQEEKFEQDMKRHRMSETEAFLKEFRPKFAKTFNDVNTANLAKKDSRKIKRIKEI